MLKKLFIIFLIGLLAFIYLVYKRSFLPVDKFIKLERERKEDKIRFYVTGSIPLKNDYFKDWQVFLNSNDAKDLSFFDGRYYLATTGGLKVYDQAFNPIRKITHLDGLEENNITSLAVFDGRLYIGLATRGLMSFYKDSFTHYLFEDSGFCKITSLFPASNELYIGTEKGLIRFDGKEFSKIGDFEKITAISLLGKELVVGTYEKGLYLLRGKKLINIGEEQGLVSNRITSLNSYNNKLFVGSPFGLDEIDLSLKIAHKKKGCFVTSYAIYNNKSYISTFNKGIIVEGRSIAGNVRVNTLKIKENTLYGLTSSGLIAFNQGGWEEKDKEDTLSSNHITSLCFDMYGNLIIGTFEDGLSVLSKDGKIKGVKNKLREINHLDFDEEKGVLRVATPQGIVLFDNNLKQIGRIKQENGLIGENISHIKRDGRRIIFSTNQGVTIEEEGIFKSLYVLHGLINNHVYCSETMDDLIYLGTLGGITLLKEDKVLRNYTVSNSKLPANWITALLKVDKELYIGTYGGGVAKITGDGNLFDFKLRFETNPNALCYIKPYLLVGTLDQGIFLYHTTKDKWYNLKNGLGSLNVSAIIDGGECIYLGTECGLLRMPKESVEHGAGSME
ncbi:MAG: two-component regulator propeller domain-containing protein [bacterium]